MRWIAPRRGTVRPVRKRDRPGKSRACARSRERCVEYHRTTMRGPGVPPASMPERVGRYEVLCAIASGGMATVYLGRARGVGGFERDVAIKLPHRHVLETSSAAVELVDEAKLAAALRHPNIVSVLDVGEDEAGVHLVMDYVEGESLNALVAASPEAGLPLGVAMRILLDVLAGLHAAHELRDADGTALGVVHRDVSPQNILVGLDGVSRLADFGVAKVLTRGTSTRTGTIKGKVAYMAPEQARGQAIDRRSDVWAAGVVAWELLAGRRLRASDNDAVNLLELVTEPPPHVGSVRADVPPGLGDVVAAALRLDPTARTSDALRLATELREACRAAGVHIAEATDVAAQASALIGGRVRALRDRADAVARARAARSSEPPGSERWSDAQGLAGAAGLPAVAVGEEGHTLARGAFVRGISEDETTRRSERNPSAADLVHGAPEQVDATRVARAVSGRSSVVTLVFAAALTLGTVLAAMFWTRDAASDADAREARASLRAGVEASLTGATRAAAVAAIRPASSDPLSVDGRAPDELPAVPVEAVPSLPPAAAASPSGGPQSAGSGRASPSGVAAAGASSTARGRPARGTGRAPDLAASPYAPRP
jgi:serine/threonine-protein kinase